MGLCLARSHNQFLQLLLTSRTLSNVLSVKEMISAELKSKIDDGASDRNRIIMDINDEFAIDALRLLFIFKVSFKTNYCRREWGEKKGRETFRLDKSK